MAFLANLGIGNGSDLGVFVGAPGSVQAAALPGTQPLAYETYTSIGSNFGVTLNDAGQVAFWAALNGGPSNSGIFVGRQGRSRRRPSQASTAEAYSVPPP